MSILQNNKWISLIIFGFAFLLYGNTLTNRFNIDDSLVIQDNELVHQGIKAIPEIFTTEYYNDGLKTFGYRPLVKATYAIEYQLWGQNPVMHHLINVILYGCIGILLFYLLLYLFQEKKKTLSLAITLLFLAHPIHTEVVASLKSRDEMLGFIFSLCTIFLAVKYADSNKIKFLILTILSLIFAHFSKLSTIPTLLIAPLAVFYFRNIDRKKNIQILFVCTLVSVLYMILLFSFLGDNLTRTYEFFEVPWVNENTLTNRFSYGMITLGFYLKKLFFPHPLGFYYGYKTLHTSGLSDPMVWIWAVIYFGILGLGIKSFKSHKIFSFGIFTFLIYIFMFSNLIPAVTGIVGERHSFHASLGFSILLGYLILNFPGKTEQIKQFIKIRYVFMGIILLAFAFKTITRNLDWNSKYTLYKSDINYLENSVWANLVYANTCLDQYDLNNNENKDKNLIKEAENKIKKAIQLDPTYAKSYNILAEIQSGYQSKYNDAILNYKKAISINNSDPDQYFNLAKTYSKKGNWNEAELNFKNCIEKEKYQFNCMFNLGAIYFNSNRIKQGKNIADQLMNEAPENYLSYNLMGVYHLTQKDTLSSVNSFLKAYDFGYQMEDSYQFAIRYYTFKNDYNKVNILKKKMDDLKNK